MPTTLYTYNADVGFVVGLPGRDITDADSGAVQTLALANSLTSNPCYTAV